MRTPAEQLAALAVLHIAELPESRRADVLDAAASIFAVCGSDAEAKKLTAIAAICRTAEEAQRSLTDLFKRQA